MQKSGKEIQETVLYTRIGTICRRVEEQVGDPLSPKLLEDR